MKKKELKNLAKKIAECELIIQYGTDNQAIAEAQVEIMRLSSRVHDFQDLDIIDEMVQDILNKMT